MLMIMLLQPSRRRVPAMQKRMHKKITSCLPSIYANCDSKDNRKAIYVLQIILLCSIAVLFMNLYFCLSIQLLIIKLLLN